MFSDQNRKNELFRQNIFFLFNEIISSKKKFVQISKDIFKGVALSIYKHLSIKMAKNLENINFDEIFLFIIYNFGR